MVVESSPVGAICQVRHTYGIDTNEISPLVKALPVFNFVASNAGSLRIPIDRFNNRGGVKEYAQ